MIALAHMTASLRRSADVMARGVKSEISFCPDGLETAGDGFRHGLGAVGGVVEDESFQCDQLCCLAVLRML